MNLKRWLERCCWCLSGISLAVLIYFATVVPRLETYRKQVWRVKANFATEEERKIEEQKAELFEVPVFEQLYEEQGEASVDVYLPKRGSNAYKIVTFFADMLGATDPVSAKEDLVVSPPAPQPDVYLDVRKSYPVEKKAVAYFALIFAAASGAAFLVSVITGALLLRARRRKIVKQVLEIPKELRELQ